MVLNPTIRRVQTGRTRPIITRSASSFTRALELATEASNQNLNLPENLSSNDLATTTKTTIKEDINLVQEVAHESTSLSLPKIQTPLLTPLPIPNTKRAFLEAVTAESTKLSHIRAGLKKYLEVIHSEEHTVFAQTFLDNQTATTNAAIAELDNANHELRLIHAEVTSLTTPAVTPALTPNAATYPYDSVSDNTLEVRKKPTLMQAFKEDYFNRMEQAEETVKPQFKEKFDELRKVVARIRGVFVGNHCFYKVNYALAADKKKGEEKKVGEEGM